MDPSPPAPPPPAVARPPQPLAPARPQPAIKPEPADSLAAIVDLRAEELAVQRPPQPSSVAGPSSASAASRKPTPAGGQQQHAPQQQQQPEINRHRKQAFADPEWVRRRMAETGAFPSTVSALLAGWLLRSFCARLAPVSVAWLGWLDGGHLVAWLGPAWLGWLRKGDGGGA